ncbi:MAG: hypothetical protein HQ581_04685 [Planctomycetes bacterium]|nr:hypothetical protein [Planctomycetota bacterium]
MNESKETRPPRFSVGSSVRVKAGVMDPDFPDVHLGDWSGTISEVERGSLTTYLVDWNRTTLRAVPPVLQDHCKEEDVAFDKMWLLEEDLRSKKYREPLPKGFPGGGAL